MNVLTKITEVNLSEFVYRLAHEAFSPIYICSRDWREIFMKQSVNKLNADKLSSVIFVHKPLH